MTKTLDAIVIGGGSNGLAASTTSFITGVMSTPMPSPSMKGTIG